MDDPLTKELKEKLFLPELNRIDFVRRFHCCLETAFSLRELTEHVETVYLHDEKAMDGFSRLALLLFEQRKYGQAEKIWRVDMDRGRIGWWQQLRYAECLSALNGVATAEEWISLVYDKYPAARNGYASLGWLVREANPEKAQLLFERDAEEGRLTSGFQLNYAVFAAEQGRMAHAVQLVEASYARQPSLKDGFARIAKVIMADRAKFSEVDALYRKDAGQHRLSVDAMGSYLRALIGRNDIDIAQQFIVFVKPFGVKQHVELCVQVAERISRSGSLEEVSKQKYVRELSSFVEGQTSLSLRICLCLVRLGMRKGAMRLYRTVQNEPDLSVCMPFRMSLAYELLRTCSKQDAFRVLCEPCLSLPCDRNTLQQWCDLVVRTGQVEWLSTACESYIFPRLPPPEADMIRECYAPAMVEGSRRRKEEKIFLNGGANTCGYRMILFGYFQESRELVLSKRDYFERLAVALDSLNVHLHVVDYADVYKPMSLPAGSSHTALKPIQGFIRNEVCCPPINKCREIKKISLLKRYETKDSFDRDRSSDAFAYCIYAEQKIRTLFDVCQPDMVLYWNPYSVYSRLAKSVSDEYHIPSIFVESNVLPGFVEFDREGCLGQSRLSRIKLLADVPFSANELHRIEQYKKYSISHILLKKKCDGTIPINKVFSRENRVVMLGGSATYGAGLVPYESHAAKTNAPFFRDDSTLLDYLIPVVEKNSWTLLYKPHPHNRADREVQYGQSCLNASDASAYDCLEEADVLITLVSSLSASALLLNKPVILAGVNGMSGKNATYELTGSRDLQRCIRTALGDGITARQKKAFDRFIHVVMTQYGYPFTQDLETICGRSVADAAHWLLTEIIASRSVCK